jgi:hypothetical protein
MPRYGLVSGVVKCSRLFMVIQSRTEHEIQLSGSLSTRPVSLLRFCYTCHTRFLEGKPNANHVRARISYSRTQQLHNMDIITQCSK